MLILTPLLTLPLILLSRVETTFSVEVELDEEYVLQGEPLPELTCKEETFSCLGHYL
jgi:hypothetical protein